MSARLDGELLEKARRSLRRRDPRLGAVIASVGPCRLRPSGDPYRALIRSVISQQLAGGWLAFFPLTGLLTLTVFLATSSATSLAKILDMMTIFFAWDGLS